MTGGPARPRPPARPAAPAGWLLARLLCVSLMILVSATQAVGAPPKPATPADNAVVTTLRPTFTWTHTRTQAVDHYEVRIETDDIGEVAEVKASLSTAQAGLDLPNDRALRWFVRVVYANGTIEDTAAANRLTVRVSTPATTAPTIVSSPTGTIRTRTPAFAWIGDRGASRWQLRDAADAPVQGADVASGSGQVVLASLADGSYRLRIVGHTLAGDDTPPAERAFSVDASPPALLTLTHVPPLPTTNPNPLFSWSGVEPGARVSWQVTGPGGIVRGPVDATVASAAVGPLTPGDYVFQVRSTDVAGNTSEWRSEPLRVAAVSAGVAGSRALPTRNTRALTPRVGARISTRRPMLRWRSVRGARLYNLQIFRISAPGALVKIRSVFPQGERFRLSRKARLAPGYCYAWRVWPYLRTGFTKKPLGLSNFCVAKTRAAG